MAAEKDDRDQPAPSIHLLLEPLREGDARLIFRGCSMQCLSIMGNVRERLRSIAERLANAGGVGREGIQILAERTGGQALELPQALRLGEIMIMMGHTIGPLHLRFCCDDVTRALLNPERLGFAPTCLQGAPIADLGDPHAHRRALEELGWAARNRSSANVWA